MAVLSFGAWLLQQTGREGWFGDLVDAAKRDPHFPRSGSPEQIYARLNQLEADSDMYQAIEDAEAEWRATTRD